MPTVSDERQRTIDDGLRRVVSSALGVTKQLGLSEIMLPAGTGDAEGTLRGQPVRLQTRRFEGSAFDGFFIATVTGVDGQLVTVMVVALPGRGTLIPVLGMDLVALAGSLSLVALDLAPTDEVFWESHARPVLTALRNETSDVLTPRPVPAFMHETFSSLAILGAARPGQETAALEAPVRLLSSLPTLVDAGRAGGERAEAAWSRGLRWREAELRNRRELDALARMFGAEFSSRYLSLLFSPDAR